MKDSLLQVRDLKIAFPYDGVLTTVVDQVSFDVGKGETLGLVGESGSGKSVTAKAILKLIEDPPGRVLGGEVLFAGRDVYAMSARELRELRGGRISMIFQEPMTSLNPVYTCGNQLVEAVRLHRDVGRAEAGRIAVEMLREVGVQSPEARMNAYPFELSGGMRQRIMIAMALCCRPALLIADEPTTALDPTIQAQILELIRDMQRQMGLSVLFITHDLGVVAEICDRVAVMYAGKIVEFAPMRTIFKAPLHPYTSGLLRAVPKLNQEDGLLETIDGSVPDFSELPAGCAFAPRCPYKTEACMSPPPYVQVDNEHFVRCVRAAGPAARPQE
ncbi:MAG: ABC transporter ATP-binding protein [Clostridia bacterium]|nr:ABC transporter ATP-binding protein [Clostridia bacterium]